MEEQDVSTETLHDESSPTGQNDLRSQVRLSNSLYPDQIIPSVPVWSGSALLSWREPQHDKPSKMVCAPSEDSDQPGHPPSLIRVFAVRMKKHWILSYPLIAQRRLWSDWADAQADLSLRWAHSHFVGFVMLRLKICLSEVMVLAEADSDIWAATWQKLQNDLCALRRFRSRIPPRLIRVFAVHKKKPWVLSYPLSAQRRLIRLGGCTGWSVFAERTGHFVGFVVRQLKFLRNACFV